MIKKIKYILIVIGIALIGVQNTSALFVDMEISSSNTFSAGSIDFELKNIDDSTITGYIIDGVNMLPGDVASGVVKINNLGSLDFEYGLTANYQSGNMALFNSLDTTITVDSVLKYTGNLSSILLAPLPIITSSTDNIDITVTLPLSAGSSLQLKGCEFKFAVHGDQIGPVVGFNDEETFMGRVSTSDWTPPVISHLMISSPGSSNGIVVITWNTDEPATSNVEIGTTTSYGVNYPLSADTIADNTSHVVDLTGLPINTDYHFRVVSTDAYGNTTYSGDYEFRIEMDWIDFVPRENIVLNEILPDPIGFDDALRPGGEWVELYNKGGYSVDVNGWKVCSGWKCVTITPSRTMSGSTVIASGGFMVVYFENTYSGGILNNTGWDVVSLYGPQWWRLRDIHWYYDSQEGKSIVRYPDGGNIWYDPIPSPGLPNNIDPVIPEEEIISIEEGTVEE